MRRIRFTKTMTLVAIFDYERLIEEDPDLLRARKHKIKFVRGEELGLYEWGWTSESTNFATDDPILMKRIDPDYSHEEGRTAVILAVPYDSFEGEPFFLPIPEEPKSVPRTAFPPVSHPLLRDSGCLESEEEVDSPTKVARTA